MARLLARTAANIEMAAAHNALIREVVDSPVKGDKGDTGDAGAPGADATARTAAAAADVLGRYGIAVSLQYNSHMKRDTGLTALSPLAGGAIQSVADTRANLMKTYINAHLAEVGSPTVNGAHRNVDATNPIVAPDGDGVLAHLITLVNAIHACANAHGGQSGFVHFRNDDALTASTITTDPPTTLAQCVTDLNDLLTSWSAHINNSIA